MGNLVEVARFYDPEEAFCARGYLQSCGIDTFLQNEHHLAAAPHMRIALGGYGLMSFADHEGDARKALEDVANIKTAPVLAESSDLKELYPSRKNWFWLPTFFFFGAWPFLPRVKSKGDMILQGFVLSILYFFIYLLFLHPIWP